ARVLGMFGDRAPVVERLLRRHAVRDQPAAVGGPLRAAAETAVLADLPQARAVGMNDVEVDELEMFPPPVAKGHVARSIGRKRNPSSVRRPRRPEVAAGT